MRVFTGEIIFHFIYISAVRGLVVGGCGNWRVVADIPLLISDDHYQCVLLPYQISELF